MARRTIERFTVLLLCAVAALGLSMAAAHAEGGITTWEELQAAVNAGGRVTLTQDIIDQQFSLGNGAVYRNPIIVPQDVTVTLDLNGHKLARKSQDDISSDVTSYPNAMILVVSGGAELILEDSAGGGMICGCYTAQGGTIQNYGTMTMNGGIITLNACFADGAGAGITNESAGILTINGGTICDNCAEPGSVGGIFNKDGGVLNLNGGVISGNYCSDGKGIGGVWNDGTVHIQGSPVVFGNTDQPSNTASNLHLAEGHPVQVVGEIVCGAHLGIHCSAGMLIASGYGEYNTSAPGAIFEADQSGCGAVLTDDGDVQIVSGLSQTSYVERSWSDGRVVSVGNVREDVTPVPDSGNMTSGWYYLNRNVTKNGRVESITGDVHLILGDGSALDVKGLYVPAGSTLTIYGQGEGTGRLYSHPSGGAGIGGYSQHDNGSNPFFGRHYDQRRKDHCHGRKLRCRHWRFRKLQCRHGYDQWRCR